MMDQGLIDVITVMGAYTLWIAIIFFLLNALTFKFLGTFIRVRASLGRLVLVKIRGTTHYFFKSGTISEGFLEYKLDKHNIKKLSVTSDGIGRMMGINFVVVDDQKNCVINPDLSSTSGFDAVKINNFMVRCLQAPRLERSPNTLIIILLVVILIGLLAVGFALFKQGEVLAILQQGANVVTNTGGGL